MINEKIAEFRTCQTHQPCIRFTKQGGAAISGSGGFNGVIWCFADSGLPVCSAGQGEQREDSYSRRFCGVYSQAATQPNQSGKEICEVQRDLDQQSGPYCAGRIPGKKESWQKRRNKLRYPIPMIVCGSKSSLRRIISLFPPTTLKPPLSIPLILINQ